MKIVADEEAFRYLRSQISDREIKGALDDAIGDAQTFGEGEVEFDVSDLKKIGDELSNMIEGCGWHIRTVDTP